MAGLEVEGEDQAGFVDPELFGDIPDVFTAFTLRRGAEVLRDGETFSSKGYADVMGQVMGHTILEMDEPEHHTYRGIVQQAFSRKAMERWEVEAIARRSSTSTSTRSSTGARAELVRELTFPFPVHVIARLLGLPPADLAAVPPVGGRAHQRRLRHRPRARRVAGARRVLRRDPRRAPRRAGRRPHQHARPGRARRPAPHRRRDLRVPAPAAPGRRGDDVPLVEQPPLRPAHQPRPARRAARRPQRSWRQAIEEGLRWEPPLLTIIRTATRDTEVEGVPVPAGSMIVVNMGSANHDEKYWADPEPFDIFRPPRQHLAFAFGPHMCLGMHLARMETRVVLDRLFDRLPGLRLDPDAERALHHRHDLPRPRRAPRRLGRVTGSAGRPRPVPTGADRR